MWVHLCRWPQKIDPKRHWRGQSQEPTTCGRGHKERKHDLRLVGGLAQRQPCTLRVTGVEVHMRRKSTQVWRSCKRNGRLSKSKWIFKGALPKAETWAEKRWGTEKIRWMKHKTDKNVQEKRNLWLLRTEKCRSANGACPCMRVNSVGRGRWRGKRSVVSRILRKSKKCHRHCREMTGIAIVKKD